MNDSDGIYKAINELEIRINNIEKHLSLVSTEEESIPTRTQQKEFEKPKKSLEDQVGVYWLAKIGILFFAIGLLFVISLSFENLPSFGPSVLGYIFAALFFTAHKYGKRWLPNIDSYLLSSGFVLLFYSTLRLSHFSDKVFISSNLLETIILFVSSGITLFYSIRKKSMFLTGIGVLFGLITTLLITNALVALICVLIISILVVIVANRFNWQLLLIFGMVLSYTIHLIWLMGNPFLSNITGQGLLSTASLFFVLGLFIIYAFGLITKGEVQKEDFLKITSIFLNSFLAAGSFIISMYINDTGQITLFTFIAFLLFILMAATSWMFEKSKYSTFFYSIIGYMLLSVSIVTGFNKPDYFIILSWQSLIVISTAIWFRSRIIIIANFIIYLMILISFLLLSNEVTYISISFGIVALFSARVLNWKKKVLELNSEWMRNAYLICAFLIFPYSLYNSVSAGYVTISWIGVAILYYILSVLLKNHKYRWLSLATLLLSVLYAIFFGITELSSELRILTFIILGVVLLVVSFLYSKRKSKSDKTVTNSIEEL